MEIFEKKNRVIDLVLANDSLLPVLNRFGISLGNKDKSIEDICEKQGLDVAFVLAIVNTYHNEEYFPEKRLKEFSPLTLIDYLKKTHSHYVNYVVPKLDNLFSELIASSGSNSHQLQIVEMFYEKYRTELLLHVQEEEEKVFPYITNVVLGEVPDASYSIHTFEKEHAHVDDKLHDLINLIIKYVEPVYNENLCNEFLFNLFRFEKDSEDHARIEDKILIPMVVELENRVNG